MGVIVPSIAPLGGHHLATHAGSAAAESDSWHSCNHQTIDIMIDGWSSATQTLLICQPGDCHLWPLYSRSISKDEAASTRTNVLVSLWRKVVRPQRRSENDLMKVAMDWNDDEAGDVVASARECWSRYGKNCSSGCQRQRRDTGTQTKMVRTLPEFLKERDDDALATAFIIRKGAGILRQTEKIAAEVDFRNVEAMKSGTRVLGEDRQCRWPLVQDSRLWLLNIVARVAKVDSAAREA